MEEAFSVKWTEFHQNISHSFNELREEETFFDVTLVADDEVQIQAHKLVLSAGSDFFKSILMKNPHSHPLIYLSGITSENIAHVLNYIYNGEVKIGKDGLYDFIKVAQKFKLQELRVDVEEVEAESIKEEDDSGDKVDIEDDTTEDTLNNFQGTEALEDSSNLNVNNTEENMESSLYNPEGSEEISSIVVKELKDHTQQPSCGTFWSEH